MNAPACSRMMRTFLLTAAATCLTAHGGPSDVDALKKGMPKDVVSFIERASECSHWGGEEPYDKERADQIGKAWRELRCDALSGDEKRLRRKYRRNSKVLKALDEAEKPY